MGLKKFKAKQLVDFNNPTSMKYMEYSHKSFNPVSDILDIEPIQCVTPLTLPSDFNFTPKKKRTIYEKACYVSHFSLIKQLSEGDSFFVLEHDAYLRPGQEELFRVLLTSAHELDIFYCGIANEFYTLSSKSAQLVVEMAERNNHNNGPMGAVLEAGKQLRLNGKFLFPVTGQKNLISLDTDIESCVRGKGTVYDAPVTQHVNIKLGVTIKERANKWNAVPEKNPDIFFTYDDI